MMRTWVRTPDARLCGKCDEMIDAGSPAQLIALRGVKKALVRCKHCAEGDAPADLPPLVARRNTPSEPFVPMRVMAGMLPLDWKSRSAGDREPGEEG